jgi:hypothetical protein
MERFFDRRVELTVAGICFASVKKLSPPEQTP